MPASPTLLGNTIAIGSDHAGFALKAEIVKHLRDAGCSVIDYGTDSAAPADYPIFCLAVAEAVHAGRATWGIVLGGSGQGEQISANKVIGIRAALCDQPYYAALARAHNDANVLSIGARIVATAMALDVVDTFWKTPFTGEERHVRRLTEIAEYERSGKQLVDRTE